MPGYIDAHAHWNGAWTAPYKVYADWEMFVNLAFGKFPLLLFFPYFDLGVTTLHNPSADTISVFQDAELIRAGKKVTINLMCNIITSIQVGPRVFSTGSIIFGNGGPSHCDVS